MRTTDHRQQRRLRHCLAALFLTGLLTAARAQEFEAGLNRSVESCRIDTCGSFAIKYSWPVATAPNGVLFDVTFTNAYKEYEPSERHAYQKVTRAENGVGNRFVFCSKREPAMFSFSDEQHQWHLRRLFPGDPLDVEGAGDTDTLLYLAACHHFFPRDWTTPAAVETIHRLGYAFTEGAAGRSELPTSVDGTSPFDFVNDLTNHRRDAAEPTHGVPRARQP